jgi:myo-inositol 2-dehydrogenase/D-chiro-inositol 1-dehydrogenase
MRFALLGAEPTERSWADLLSSLPEHEIVAASPGWQDRPSIPIASDLDALLATPNLDAVIVGGPVAERAEALRRTAAEGLTIIVLHPPGAGPESYDQVALTPQETGARIIPDLFDRLHPAWRFVREVLASQRLGELIRLSCEATSSRGAGSLIDPLFARLIDTARSVAGEVLSVTATGSSTAADEQPRRVLIQLRATSGAQVEFDLRAGEERPPRWRADSSGGVLSIEAIGPAFDTWRVVTQSPSEPDSMTDFPPWSPRLAGLQSLRSELPAGEIPLASLADGTRACEIAEAAARSLSKHRTIELHRIEASELGNFKSLMTATGCSLLLGILLLIPIALAGPPLGFPATVYLAWVIPPALVLFALFQLFRFLIPQKMDGQKKHS